VSLVCRATGSPSPQVFWRRAGRRVNPTTITSGSASIGTPAMSSSGAVTGGRGQTRYSIVELSNGSVLRIEPVLAVAARREEDISTHLVFECVAENSVGEPATASATIDVYAPDVGEYMLIHRITLNVACASLAHIYI